LDRAAIDWEITYASGSQCCVCIAKQITFLKHGLGLYYNPVLLPFTRMRKLM